MLISLLLVLQLGGCPGEALDLRAARACTTDDVARVYLDGLIAAFDAYALGGTPESLTPVRQAIARLEKMAKGNGPTRIAAYVLHAAAAAAQSERDEMFLYLDQAVLVEALELNERRPGAPVVSAHEAAGDLWMLVHRYADALETYRIAAARVGLTPRIRQGIARACEKVSCAAAQP